MASSSVLPDRHQPGQSMAHWNVLLAPVSRAVSIRSSCRLPGAGAQRPSVAARRVPTRRRESIDVAPVRPHRVDERRRHDHAVGAGLRDRPDVGRLAHAESDRDRDRRDGLDLADERADRRRQRRPRAGHPDERDAIEEAPGPARDPGAAVRRGRRGDEVDDRQSGGRGRPPRTGRPRRASGRPRSGRPRRPPPAAARRPRRHHRR